MNRLLPLLAFFLILPHLGHAEKAPEPPEVRFVAQIAPPDLGQVVLAAGELRTAPFDLPVNNLSPAQKPPQRNFNLMANDKNVSLATINLPPEGDSFIVLLVVAAKGGYTPIVIPAKNPNFKGGDMYFHNLADKPILGHVGTAKFLLPAGQGTFLTPRGGREEKFYDVGLGVREPEGDRVLATTRWPEDNQMRNYIFFYVDPTTRRITYRAVDEFIEPENPPG